MLDAEQALRLLGEDAIEVLETALVDHDADLRILVLQLLEHFDGNTEPPLPLLIQALEDPDRIVAHHPRTVGET